ncbi:MFS transporter [Ellagibacter isourolithinifaciens]|uniref:MFS transporter n=1 Tax=Ellagibacter isourolithinifaciens TaxID=2137581 RepID=A0A6N6NJC1_9ACTN|nr:MFS transporter [Ellagibacter isourolithinifaciens]KAB1636045.1 MFS transporter [Ellagibacter isourolithinifaciens]
MDKQREHQNWLIVSLCFFLVAFCITLMMYKIPTIMIQLMELLSVSAATAAWFMSVFTFTGIFLAIPIGFLIKGIGVRKVVIVSGFLAAFASIAGSFAPEVGFACVPLLIVTRGLEGLSFVGIIASIPIMIQMCIIPSRVGTSTGIFMLGGMLGAMGGGVITPTVFTASGFAGLWIAYAAFMALSTIVFMVYVRFPRQEQEGAFPESKAATRSSSVSIYGVFFKPNTLLFFLGFAAFQILLLSVLTYAPTALQQRGMSPAMSGFVSTLPQLISIVTAIAFGAIADAIHRTKPLVIIGMIAMAICAPAALVTDTPVLWAILVAMGLLAMGVPTVVMAAYPKLLADPSKLTVGMGVMMLVQSLGQFLGSLIPSIVLGPDLSNWTVCSIVLFLLGLAATACFVASKFK